eukprot:TRINITY_DN17099_c0_g1_i3.p6 TRINITY_DN17099_c0_g1~~TRINITY_DN17099_c0_g1_i3.p6  ORF type:complete len:145 (-),score=29.63 TRINITY_DN17099_c0_g1_i3:520-954(-)
MNNVGATKSPPRIADRVDDVYHRNENAEAMQPETATNQVQARPVPLKISVASQLKTITTGRKLPTTWTTPRGERMEKPSSKPMEKMPVTVLHAPPAASTPKPCSQQQPAPSASEGAEASLDVVGKEAACDQGRAAAGAHRVAKN